MTYPQQPSDPQYQQPMYPPPATAQPATPAGTSMDFSALTRPENRPYVIAGGGGLVALIAFLFLPFYTVSYNIAGVSSGSASGSGSQMGGWLWLTALAALAALVVAALMALNIRAVAQLTPVLATRILVGSGIVGLVSLLFYFLSARGATDGLGILSGSGFSAGVGFGFYITVLAMIAVLVGGVMQMRRPQMM